MNESSGAELFVCLVKNYPKVEKILAGLLKLGITGATVINGRGMSTIISKNIPVFSGLRTLFPQSELQTYIVFSVLPHEVIADVVKLINEVCGDLKCKGTGMYFSIPVNRVSGLTKGKESPT